MKEQFLKEIRTILDNCISGKLDYNLRLSGFYKMLRIEYAIDTFVYIEFTYFPRKEEAELEISGKYITNTPIKLNEEELTEISYLFNLLHKSGSELLLKELININNDTNL